MVLWADGHEETGNQAPVRQMREDKDEIPVRSAKALSGKDNPLIG